MKIFIDTNILLDVLLNREPFADNSLTIWSLAENRKVKAYISSISFNNVFYILRRMLDSKQAYHAMVIMRELFHVIPLNDQIIGKTIEARFNDFEDGIQLFSAIHANIDYLISRNIKDFPTDKIPVLTPASFLALRIVTK